MLHHQLCKNERLEPTTNLQGLKIGRMGRLFAIRMRPNQQDYQIGLSYGNNCMLNQRIRLSQDKQCFSYVTNCIKLPIV